jgi:hypothetical protein
LIFALVSQFGFALLTTRFVFLNAFHRYGHQVQGAAAVHFQVTAALIPVVGTTALISGQKPSCCKSQK